MHPLNVPSLLTLLQSLFDTSRVRFFYSVIETIA